MFRKFVFHPTSLLISLSLFVFPVLGQEDVEPAQIDELFAGWTEPNTPGGVVGVFLRGEMIYANAFGMANLASSTPITLDTGFNIASMAKTFTALAVLLLEEQGSLQLSDDIRTYLPGLINLDQPITIYQLLHHQSGLRNISTLLAMTGINGSDVATEEEVLRIIASQEELNHVPGERAVYSNTNFILLARIVETVSGQSFQDFTSEYIFQPLGMSSTYFVEYHSQAFPGVAQGYTQTVNGSFEEDMPGNYGLGTSGLITTLNDFARWERNFWQLEVGSQELFTSLFAKGVFNHGYESVYAKGTGNVTYRGLQSHGMSGATSGFRGYQMQFPDSGLSIVILANSTYDVATLSLEIASLYLEQEFQRAEGRLAMEDEKFISLPAAEYEKYAGVWKSADTGELVYSFPNPQNESLFLSGIGFTAQLQPTSSSEFESPLRGDITSLRFQQETSDSPSLSVFQNGELIFSGESLRQVQPDPDYLQQFAGSYTSAELDSSFELLVLGKQLYRRRADVPDRLLVGGYADLFETDGGLGTMLFERSPAGEVTGFRMSVAGVHNLLFAKN